MKTRIAIIGYGNIGKVVEQAVLAAEDMQLVGIYHHSDNLDDIDADVAAMRMKAEQRFGTFTMIEIPPIYMLPGDEETLIRTLV